MAGPFVPEIYCWEVSLDDLHIYLASTRQGALRIGLALKQQGDSKTFFRKTFPSAKMFKSFHLNQTLIRLVKAVFYNEPTMEDIGFDFTCTAFQQKVLDAVSRIPFGETRSYKEVACMIASPKSARAVGRALGKNPLPLIFP